MLVRVLLAVLLLRAASAQMSMNGTESGSGSGDSTGDCSTAGCTGQCLNTTMGPVCYCPVNGTVLAADDRTCIDCMGGYWGDDCRETCPCEKGSTCNRANGTCICASCYTGERCETFVSSSCIEDFIMEPDKRVEVLTETYGFNVLPDIPSGQTRDLFDMLLNDATTRPFDNGVIGDTSASQVNRDAVGQGPLLQLQCILNRNFNRPLADRALETLRAKVNDGQYRVTLIILTLTGTHEITINAGSSI